MTMLRIALLTAAIFLTGPAFGHGGGLNAQGCHNDRKRGGYRCHRKQQGIRTLPGRARSLVARATGGAYYQNCAAARAAGAAPIRAGQDGYSRKLDRDGDGIACE